MKKVLLVLVMAGLLMAYANPAPKPALAQARRGLFTSSAIETSTALVLPAKTWVYAIRLFADQASSVPGLYNTATLGGATASTVKAEIGEATQFDTEEIKYNPPINFPNGVSVIMSTGVLLIDYGATP